MCKNTNVKKELRCKALRNSKTCLQPIPDNGVENSGFCENCWYPSIVDDYDHYSQLRADGYQRADACRLAGIDLFDRPAAGGKTWKNKEEQQSLHNAGWSENKPEPDLDEDVEEVEVVPTANKVVGPNIQTTAHENAVLSLDHFEDQTATGSDWHTLFLYTYTGADLAKAYFEKDSHVIIDDALTVLKAINNRRREQQVFRASAGEVQILNIALVAIQEMLSMTSEKEQLTAYCRAHDYLQEVSHLSAIFEATKHVVTQ